MEFIQINENQYYFKAAVNIGYVKQAHSNKGLLIDAGLDQQSMKKVLRKLDEEKLPVTHLFVTHSHADHYGGAAFLQEKFGVYTMAPYLEEAILRYPILASSSFFQSNLPIDELRNKFIEGQAIHIHQVIHEGVYEIDGFHLEFISLPGHSLNQLGVKVNDLLYASDSYFGTEALDKHKIPYIVDLEQTFHSLEKLQKINCEGAIPGHGEFEEKFQSTITANQEKHQEILHSIKEIIDIHPNGISHEQLVQLMCNRWDVVLTNMTSWALYRTAITSYLTMLYKNQEIQLDIIQNTLTVRKKEGEA
ncbi:MBL fold metallo-hydrolase [Bacillus pinisoli]|uniref:MBL fold metallo-hydrolase n=1 Tax=Bacillus pinisoli TaxID=2901866 RepID=UPI001FF54EEB|nr:MBL fold metallo-hydrolase [Bacillus pinisoli]